MSTAERKRTKTSLGEHPLQNIS